MKKRAMKLASLCLTAGILFSGTVPVYADEVNSTQGVQAERVQAVSDTDEDTGLIGQLAFAKCEEYINIRSEANTDSEITAKIYNNGAATIIGQVGDWYEITSGNAKGYVKAEYFVTGEKAQELAQALAYNVATVHPEELNIRTGPGEDYGTKGVAYQKEELEVVDYSGDWMKVALGSDEYGYINAYYVSYNTYYSVAETLEEEQARLNAEYEALLAAQQSQEAEASETSSDSYEESADSWTDTDESSSDETWTDETWSDDSSTDSTDDSWSDTSDSTSNETWSDETWSDDTSTDNSWSDTSDNTSDETWSDETWSDDTSVDDSWSDTSDSSSDETWSDETWSDDTSTDDSWSDTDNSTSDETWSDETWNDNTSTDDTWSDTNDGSSDETWTDETWSDDTSTDETWSETEVVSPDETWTETEAPQETEAVQETESSVSTGQSIADYAVQFVGNPYVWGGTSLTNGADCSGFVQSVFANFGIGLARTAADQSYGGTGISLDSLQAGDLVFYGSSGIDHVALYIGGGQVVHAANSKSGIIISSCYYNTPVCARRYW